MKKFRKKPIVIEAHQWFKNGDHPEDGPAFRHGNHKEGAVVRYFRHPQTSGTDRCTECDAMFDDHGWIDTLEDGHRVCPGDWIITGVQNERYPCKDSIFKATYDAVEEEVDA